MGNCLGSKRGDTDSDDDFGGPTEATPIAAPSPKKPVQTHELEVPGFEGLRIPKGEAGNLLLMIPSLRKKLDDAFDRSGGRDHPPRFLNCYTQAFVGLKDALLASVVESKFRVEHKEHKREGLNHEFLLTLRSPSGRLVRIVLLGSDDLSGMVVFAASS